MSGRPKNPDWTVEPFAPDANYGVGSLPWEGNPTKTAWAGASSVGFTPKLGVPAQAMNFVLNAFATDDQNAKDAIDALTDFTGQIQALNWQRLTSSVALSTTRPFFNAGLGAWIVPGDAAIAYTFDGGNTISSFGSVSNVSGETLTCGDADASGDMVIAGQSRYVFQYASGVWTRRDVFGFAGSLPGVQCVYDPVHDRWVWGYYSVSTHMIKHSADGATWTETATYPSGDGWGSDDYGTQLFRMAVKKSTGRIVAVVGTDDGVAHSGEQYFATATSDDGGATWTTRADIYDAGTDDATTCDLTYDADTDTWWFCHGESSTPSGRLYKSTDDGVTWTLVSALTTRRIRSLACHGALLVGVVENGSSVYEVAWSSDAGVTWHNTQFRPSSGDIRAGRGDLMIAGSGYILTSLRAGLVGDEIA